MGQDMFNEAYKMGYDHGKAHAYMVSAIVVAACLVIGLIVYPLAFT